MWTGFRLALGGAQEYFGVRADLACYSKAVANGMPISVLAGRADIMTLCEKDVFFYTTFGGEALSLAAARATILEMREQQVHKRLFEAGGRLRNGLTDMITDLGIEYLRCVGYSPRSMLTFDASVGNPLILKSFVQQELIKRGILWSGFHTLSYSHSDADIDHTLAAWRQVLSLLDDAVSSGRVEELLRGTPVEPVFRKTSNFNTRAKVSASSR
jgi:glutamate-1-semialdehyde aminotransferase